TGAMTPGPISSRTIGSLEWNSMKVGVADAPLPESNEHVWTTPRKVDGAANLTTLNESGKPESEKFLFYRGVGKIDAPVVATQAGGAGGKISLSARAESVGDDEHVAIDKLWVMRIDASGTCIGAPVPALASPDARVTVPVALEQQ